LVLFQQRLTGYTQAHLSHKKLQCASTTAIVQAALRRITTDYHGVNLMIKSLLLTLLLLSVPAHAESIMSPMDDKGRLVDQHIPFWDQMSDHEKLERLRDRQNLHCLQGYNLEFRSIGPTCVRPAGR
jgi:hypothetical protein